MLILPIIDNSFDVCINSNRKHNYGQGNGVFKESLTVSTCIILNLLVRSSFIWRLGSHLVHSMHGALKLLPYSLVNHSLPMYCRFSLECFGNHIYAASRAKTIGVSSTSELPISSWGKICLSLYAFVLIFHVAFLLHAYSKYSILSMFFGAIYSFVNFTEFNTLEKWLKWENHNKWWMVATTSLQCDVLLSKFLKAHPI